MLSKEKREHEGELVLEAISTVDFHSVFPWAGVLDGPFAKVHYGRLAPRPTILLPTRDGGRCKLIPQRVRKASDGVLGPVSLRVSSADVSF
jgi:hypothetical protein